MTVAPADRPVAVFTGASSGIGAATARALAAAGFAVALGARRVDRCAALAAEIDGTALRLDVTDQETVDAFAAAVPDCRLLVNNAGGAHGLEPVAEADVDDWRWMFETNVLNFARRVEIARHGFESVTLKLASEYDDLRETCAKHGIEISANRVRKVVRSVAENREKTGAWRRILEQTTGALLRQSDQA